jgi:predicted CoA-binding protein
MDNTKKTLVMGASPNPERYSWKAVTALRRHQQEVVAVGNRSGMINDVIIHTDLPAVKDIDTITLYMNAHRQEAFYDYLLGLSPKRLIFNPGAENSELKALAQERGIETVEGCTLVMLSIGNY